MSKQLITCLDLDEVAEYVLLSGEPERVPKIAALLEGSREVKQVREFTIYEGMLDGESVTVASTGIGGPSAAILIEELANLGAKTFLRIGTSGGIADDLEKGDFVINTGAIRADGTSRSYAWLEFPAFAHHEVILALIRSARMRNAKFTTGIAFSIDGFYTENKILGEDTRLNSMSHNGFFLRERNDRLADVKAMGAKNIEMENATLFTLGNIFGLRTGAICVVSDMVPWHPTDKNIYFEKNMSKCIEIGVDAISTLIKWDRERGDSEYWCPE